MKTWIRLSLLTLAMLTSSLCATAQSVYYPIKYGTTPGTEFICGGGAPLQSLNCDGLQFLNPDGTTAGTLYINDTWTPNANLAGNWVEWPTGLESEPWPKAMIGGTTCYEQQDFAAGNQRLSGACTLLGFWFYEGPKNAPTYTGTISLHMTYFWSPGRYSLWRRQIITGAVTLTAAAQPEPMAGSPIAPTPTCIPDGNPCTCHDITCSK